jgi:hypothetical protein
MKLRKKNMTFVESKDFNMRWNYTEMGSRDKKTGKLKYYQVTVEDWKIIDCKCEARSFRRFSPCKHMTNLQTKLSHLTL